MRIAAALLLLAGTTAFSQDLPTWLKLGGSYRGRGEFTQSADFERGENLNYYLGRLRVNADMTPRSGFEVYVEGQDARVAGISQAGSDGMMNKFDFRQAWVGIGTEKSPVRVQIGRQELAYGDERLVGADNPWDALGFTWDAAQVTFTKGALQIKSFAAARVSVTPQAMDRPDTNERLYGLYFTLPEPRKGLKIEPYFFYNQQLHHCNPEDEFVTNQVAAFGFRSTGNITHQLDYNVEMAAERGQFDNQAMRSWAGHWEIGWRFGQNDNSPRLRAEYNLASGDKNPNDNVHSTFDDLYPAGYNAYGMSDPFAWRNISNPALRFELPVKGNLTLLAGWRWYELNTVADGLYSAGEDCVTRNPAATSGFVGQQFSMAAAWDPSPHWNVRGGYARFFNGPYLTQSGFEGHMSSPYVSLAFLF